MCMIYHYQFAIISGPTCLWVKLCYSMFTSIMQFIGCCLFWISGYFLRFIVYLQKLTPNSNQFSFVLWPTLTEHGVAFWPEEDTSGDAKAEPTCAKQSNAGPWQGTPANGTAREEGDSRHQKDGQTGSAGMSVCFHMDRTQNQWISAK